MERRWTTLDDLGAQFVERAMRGKSSTLSPATAKLVGEALIRASAPRPAPRPRDKRFDVDVFSEGSAIYRLLSGEIDETVAWAQNALVAYTAFDALVERYPKDVFSQRRRSWVERDTRRPQR